MATPDCVTQIGVGSSTEIWALDAKTGALYRRDALTQKMVEVEDYIADNIVLQAVGVSPNGDALALSQGGHVYTWNEYQDQFVFSDGSQTFDEIDIGSNSLWGRSGTSVYVWDDVDREFVEMFSDVVALAVAKQDDTTYVIDSSGLLLKYSYDTGNWLEVFAEPVGFTPKDLIATDESNIWALASDGALYQYNSINYEDPDAPTSSFIAQSAKLGLSVVRRRLRQNRPASGAHFTPGGDLRRPHWWNTSACAAGFAGAVYISNSIDRFF